MTAAAGWYPDPEDARRWRWWDGARWNATEAAHTTGPERVAQPLQTLATGTIWIWIHAVVPAIGVLVLLFVDGRALAREIVGVSVFSVLGLSPDVPWDVVARVVGVIVLLICVGVVTSLLSVLLAWLDHRRLRARGLRDPFSWHFAWLDLVSGGAGTTVYMIGRASVVWQRTRQGLAPLWAWLIAGAVAAMVVLVIVLVWSGYLIETVFEVMPYLEGLY